VVNNQQVAEAAQPVANMTRPGATALTAWLAAACTNRPFHSTGLSGRLLPNLLVILPFTGSGSFP